MKLYGRCRVIGYCECGLCREASKPTYERKLNFKKKPKPKGRRPIMVGRGDRDYANLQEVYLSCGCAMLDGKKVLYCEEHNVNRSR